MKKYYLTAVALSCMTTSLAFTSLKSSSVSSSSLILCAEEACVQEELESVTTTNTENGAVEQQPVYKISVKAKPKTILEPNNNFVDKQPAAASSSNNSRTSRSSRKQKFSPNFLRKQTKGLLKATLSLRIAGKDKDENQDEESMRLLKKKYNRNSFHWLLDAWAFAAHDVPDAPIQVTNYHEMFVHMFYGWFLFKKN